MNATLASSYSGLRKPTRRFPFKSLKSVELFFDDLNQIYQFKVWGNALTSLFVLVKDGSDLLNRIHVGSTYRMKYYPGSEEQTAEWFDTRIRYMHKVDEGRFKGHYLTGLSIL